MQLGQVLVRQGFISPSELEKTLQIQSQQKQKLGSLLMSRGVITADQLTTALREQYWRNHGYWVID